ncbi:MAG: NAD(P)H-quinone oxidoreductase subunit 5, chloroplastic [Devosia sp.]|uniref:hydrogen gas-evolving membrane-bound hydrogenase subunit E n=1 Tax=Devosia sp. TaxID=1871048 RepID=UPI0026179AE4|nr:hydrogen gas-evolving membrane-bound hydrogenase subunit E [Devosia sp.]MDB5541533.1 NAD(P)H-quinone oxidoreductase subunit 5, chloroplastic [Devosia sp.]
MEATPDIAIALVVLLPFVAAALAPLVHRLIGDFAGWVVALAPPAGFVALWGLIGRVSEGEAIAVAWPWAPSLGLELSFLVDGLSLTFALAIAGIGALILLYSGAYLKGHRQGRFLGFMLAFMGAMQGLVLADNLVALYLFWELTSIASFLLIGFDHTRQAARRAAIQALVVTGVGGLALLAAGVVIHNLSGAWELSVAGDLKGSVAYPLLVGLTLLAAFTKSAQLPFHFWLPNAMEAPTPVSAYLHSATMVQGGVYLVARMTPHLGGEPIWNTTLMVFGGATLLWGAVAALRQTDMKLMLAQTTVASLGLLMLLLGAGTELAVTAAVLYFISHALYKAGLFLVAGAIDHGTGTRDIMALGGLRDPMTVTFIGTIMASAAMFGVPPLLAFFAKEEMYAALTLGQFQSLLALLALVIGNALLGAIGLVLLVKPFMGPLLPTPIAAHEAPVAMLVGPIVLGALGIFLGFVTTLTGELSVAPATAAILGVGVETHLRLGIDFLGLPFWLSVVTWALAIGLYMRLDVARTFLRRVASGTGWSFDRGFDWVYFGIVRFGAGVTRLLHHGRLEFYLLVVFVALAVAAIEPLWLMGGLPGGPGAVDLRFYEWGVVLLAVVGVATVVYARSRLFAILALGVQGVAVAMLYLLFGAPDLSFTQFMVEILSVVILALVMTRLDLVTADPRPLEDWARDGAVALFGGIAVTGLLWAVIEGPFDPRLAAFFDANSVLAAHGHNVVNVILVDFRGLDTLGEISVVMTAGIAILALIRGARRPKPAVAKPVPEVTTEPKPRPRRTRKVAA